MYNVSFSLFRYKAIVCKLILKFKYKRSLSERALKAGERQSLHALSVERYTMTGALSLTIGITFVFKFPGTFKKGDRDVTG